MSQLDPTTPPAAAGAPATPTRPPADDPEVVYFEGRPVLRADQFKAILWVVLGLALITLMVLNLVLEWGWPWWVNVILILGAVAAVVLPMLITRTTRYRITSYRIEFERGILTKRIDSLELWHVDDISFEQGVVDRMMNVGSITVISNDKTTPRLELHGLPNPRQIFDALKNRIIAVKRQRGVIKVDTGS
jgi:membrane protein YdbS with pleckstrin-like domain